MASSQRTTRTAEQTYWQLAHITLNSRLCEADDFYNAHWIRLPVTRAAQLSVSWRVVSERQLREGANGRWPKRTLTSAGATAAPP